MNKDSILKLSASLGVVLLNAVVGHYLPLGLVLSLFIPPLATFIMLDGLSEINPLWKSLLTFLLVSLNDVALKLYGYGTHDKGGLDWANSFFLFGLIPTFAILLISIVRDKKVALMLKIAGIVIFPVMILEYLHLFFDLGVAKT